MEQFKLDFFKKEHKNLCINFTTLSKIECESAYASFCLSYKMEMQNRNDIFRLVQNKGHYINSINAKDDDFNLYLLIHEQNISQIPTHLNVCWDCFYTIDHFGFNDLVNYFDYIWYPSVDDIIIFDEACKICLMVRHDGVIYRL